MITHRRSLCLATLVTSAIVACHPKPKPDATAVTAASSDDRIVDMMEKMRARALRTPGGAPEASDFAFDVTQLYKQGVTKRRPISPALVAEAVRCLDDARTAQPDMGADLLARKGELLLAADQPDAGVAALRASIGERPNLRAFRPLIGYYEAKSDTAEIGPLCKKTLPAMKTDENRYLVLDACLKATGGTPESGLKWAGSREIAFYKTHKKELDARAAKAEKTK